MTAAWLAALTAVAVAAATALGWAARWAWHLLRATARFLDEWYGGGRDRPGVIARLKAHEDMLAKILQETRPDGGTSLRDAVTRTEATVAGIKYEQKLMRGRLEQLETQRARREDEEK